MRGPLLARIAGAAIVHLQGPSLRPKHQTQRLTTQLFQSPHFVSLVRTQIAVAVEFGKHFSASGIGSRLSRLLSLTPLPRGARVRLIYGPSCPLSVKDLDTSSPERCLLFPSCWSVLDPGCWSLALREWSLPPSEAPPTGVNIGREQALPPRRLFWAPTIEHYHTEPTLDFSVHPPCPRSNYGP